MKEFSNEKNSPVGYGPFVRVCIKYENKKEAENYIAMVKDPQDKSELYLEIGNIRESVECATKLKDPKNLLKKIYRHCKTEEDKNFIINVLKQFN